MLTNQAEEPEEVNICFSELVSHLNESWLQGVTCRDSAESKQTQATFTPCRRIWCENMSSGSSRSYLFGFLHYCFMHHLLFSNGPLLPSRRLFPRSLIGNWNCLTANDSRRCCCALSVVMWTNVFIGNLHKNSWGNERPGIWSSLMAQSVIGDDYCGEMIWSGRGPTLQQNWLSTTIIIAWKESNSLNHHYVNLWP